MSADGWHTLHITDASGWIGYRVTASPMATASELRNLTRIIGYAKDRPDFYPFDADTACVVVDGQRPDPISDDALLAELTA